MDKTLISPAGAGDYGVVRAAIEYLSSVPADEADIGRLAADLGLTQRQLSELFRRWAGLTPTAFAHCVTLDHARRLLAEQATVLDAAYELGLSSPARLYDLFVTHEAMPPGVYRARGQDLDIRYGFHPSPFGEALVMITDYGLAGIGFSDAGRAVALEDMKSRWPRARYTESATKTAAWAARAFEPSRWRAEEPLRVVLIGTDFEIRVWETLLKIRPGAATTYGDVASQIGRPGAARAVGAAVGRNPISFVVPCHRVLGKDASLTGYHWGLARKQAMLGWEAGLTGSAA
ncbi:MAG TPA: methylated-DNA--[protein]-cysteine S-methyltransferase [Devosiaceae bacterium]|nr:methylated-DNA--[protein]-cysteine S-methyltransferase [Devosiaceae bacterium]